MFYESQNSLHGDLLKIETGWDFDLPPHLHSSFECITVTEGEMTVTVDKIQYSLVPGKGLLIFPNQVHDLHTPGHSRHILCIFSSQLVHAYSNSVLGKLPEDPVFSSDDFYVQQLFRVADDGRLLRVKGILYSLCAAFDCGFDSLRSFNRSFKRIMRVTPSECRAVP